MRSARRPREVPGALASFRWRVVLAVTAALATTTVAQHQMKSGAQWCSEHSSAKGGHGFDPAIWESDVNKVESREEYDPLILHCCPRHFLKIRWFRVDKRGVDVELVSNRTLKESTFIVLEEGRVLKSDQVQERDSGLYKCVVERNDSNPDATLTFKVNITVPNKLKKPELVGDSSERFTWRVGETQKIDCIVIGGKSKDLKWMQVKSGSFTPPNMHDKTLLTNVEVLPANDLNTTSNNRNVPRLMGQYIIFKPLKKENFGNFSCFLNGTIIKNVTLLEGVSESSEELTISLACLSVVFVLLFITISIGWFWRWEILLLWKDRFGRLEENDDKEYDVFVSYDTQDAPFVLGILVPVLEDHFHYRCYAWERDSLAGEWISETLVQSIRMSRRFLMVLSPALLENRWCIFALHIALKAVLQLKLHIICVKLQDIDWSEISEADKSTNDTIRQVLYVVRTVEWKKNKRTLMNLENHQFIKEGNIFNFDRLLRRRDDTSNDTSALGQSRFWRKLRLYLPPRRSLPVLHKQPESPTSTKSLLSLPRGCEYC